MSAVKTLGFGFLVIATLVQTALGGSIQSGVGSAQRWQAGISQAPTTLVYAAPVPSQTISFNGSHQVGAENLASPSSNTSPSWGSGGSTTTQGSVTGLFLGLSGANSSSAANPGTSPVNMAGGSNSAPTTLQSWSPAPASVVSSAPAAHYSADAFINFGSGPYPEAASLTTGNPSAFFNSPVFTHLYGSAGPSSTDISKFENEVVSTIQSTYNRAGLQISLTTDPNTSAAHTMSIVSGASYASNPNAIGITDVGNNGFSFIDKFSAAQNPDQLAIAIGHNLSHELMHAFGIANHPEQSGPYVDAATSTFQTLADPSTSFSPVAANLLSTLNFQAIGQSVTASTQHVDGDQILVGSASPVPEPSTVALWTLAGGVVVAVRRRKAS